ncbi:uncharacterized protein LOC115620290 [Scaptodrosophila lebanonensis]|uniref:Uncharacterized protein LOC115620290 n=1 Tax=Drosophila lebanonensis TaxID=7225 RepID=A0A6J2T372_DROLE|nr:uncharacterized protein LOC115620290 [Scaptodrosophila lebanonensis]
MSAGNLLGILAACHFLALTWCHPLATNYTIDILRLAKAAHLKAYMQEEKHEACDNFYKFACGNWKRLHPARLHNTKTNYLEQLQVLYVRKSAEMLKSSMHSFDTSADRLLKHFFGSCTAQANDTQSELSALFKVIDFRGGWPDIRVPSWYQYEYDWLNTIAALKRRLGVDILIGLDVILDYKEENIHRLKIGAPNLPLGKRHHYLDAEYRDIRDQYVRDIAQKLRSYFPQQSVRWFEEVATQVLTIEQQLAKGLPHNPSLTLDQTTRERSVAVLKEAYGSYVDISRYLNLIFNDTLYVELYETPDDYLSNLVNVIKLTPKLQLANYTIWRALEFFDGARVPHHEQPDTWCVHQVQEFFPHQLESLFHRNYNSMQMINEVQSTWADIKRVFREALQASEELHWLTLETRQKAIVKLEAMELQFRGHHERELIQEVHGLSLRPDQFYTNFLNVLQWRTNKQLSKLLMAPELEDAVYKLPHYELTTNKIQIPITFLQARFFWDPAYPNALKYGTLGVLLAQQMLRGFDGLGRRYDRHGYQNNWWDRDSENAYSRRAQCFEEQYETFVEFQKRLVRDTNMLSRAVADNGALNIGYRAYQKWFKNSAETAHAYHRETLPLLDYSHNQLFYLAYAQLWCSDYPDSLEIFDYLPEEVRVNAALSNTQEFSNIYSCSSDNKLNKRHKSAHSSDTLSDPKSNNGIKSASSFHPIFQTEETVRQNKANIVRRSMKLSADPCTDFYEYACGNWEHTFMPQKQLEAQIDSDLLRLLDDPVQREDSALVRQAKEFYKSCVTVQSNQSQQHQQFLSEFIQQNGGFPAVPGSHWSVHHHNYDWVHEVGKLRRSYGLDVLIGLHISYNYANVHENSIYLGEPSMLIPPELCSKAGTKMVDIRDAAYEDIERGIAAHLKAWLALSSNESKRLAANILTFEYELCGSIEGSTPWDPDLQLYRANYSRKTLAEFSRLFGGKLDFNEYVRISFGQPVDKPVYMAAPNYYQQLIRTVEAYNISEVANYIMYRALSMLSFPVDDQLHRRSTYCLANTKQYLPAALGELYYRQYVNYDTKSQLLDMYVFLKNALKLSTKASWVTEGTRRVAERKIDNLAVFLPEYHDSMAYKIQLERNNYWHNLKQVLAQTQAHELERLQEGNLPHPRVIVQAYETRIKLRPVQQRIELGWAILQTPYYDPRYGHAVRFATLGPLLAQQLAAAFDDMHWSIGIMERDQWDSSTAWEYNNRSKCFNRQVTNYLQHNSSAEVQLIGSSAALNLAFHAYLMWLGLQEPHNEFARLAKETLPGLNFSNTALFFITYAQQHCRLDHHEKTQLMGKNERSMPRYSARQSHTSTESFLSQFFNVNMETTTNALLLLSLFVGSVHVQHSRRVYDSSMERGIQMSTSFAAGVSPTTNTERREEHKVRQSISKDMQRYMNLTVDPCDDFYEYACGNWFRYQTRHLRSGELGTAQQLVEANIREQLQRFLTQPTPSPHHPNAYNELSMANIRKVRDVYNACLTVNANGVERRKFLMKIVKDHGGLRQLPNSGWQHEYHWLQMLAALRRNFGLDILIGFDVDLNLLLKRGNSIYLGEPQLTIIPAEYCSAMATQMADVRDEVYEKIQQEIANNMRVWFGMERGEAERFAGDIVRFEFELCKHMREDETLPDTALHQQPGFTARGRVGQDRLRLQQPPGVGNARYPGIMLAELTAKMDNFIDFKLYVESIIEASYTEVVYLRSQTYLTHLVRTAKSYNRYTISGYIIYRALLELNQPPDEHATRRPQSCVKLMQRLFPQVLGEMYQHNVHRVDAQNDLEQIFRDLVKAFEQQLKVDWLDENDRRAARTKLSQYHMQFPDYQNVDLKDLHIQKGESFWQKFESVLRYNAAQQLNRIRGNDFGRNDGSVDAFEVRAEIAPRQQAVSVGLGLLQTPFYNYYYPRALKYALLGQRMARALLYAFDDEGWNKHPQATAPWNELTMSGYRNATECQRAQYSNYLYNQPQTFKNATQLRELISDSSALNVAFNAYLGWLELTDPKMRDLLLKETLPSMDFTNTQLFFIYFAQTRCFARQDEQPAMDFLPLTKHTPERWAVNGPLSNSEEFGKEFNCPVGTHMNSDDKCLVY